MSKWTRRYKWIVIFISFPYWLANDQLVGEGGQAPASMKSKSPTLELTAGMDSLSAVEFRNRFTGKMPGEWQLGKTLLFEFAGSLCSLSWQRDTQMYKEKIWVCDIIYSIFMCIYIYVYCTHICITCKCKCKQRHDSWLWILKGFWIRHVAQKWLNTLLSLSWHRRSRWQIMLINLY